MFEVLGGLAKLAVNTVDLALKPVEPVVNAANEVVEAALETANEVVDEMKNAGK